MTTTPRDLERLAQSVKRHRLQQYPSRDAAADAAGITRNTWKRVETGDEVRESTYAKVDQALGWAVGSCLLIAEGGNPVLAADGAATESAPAASISGEDARRAVFEAARTTLPDAPIGELDAFSDELVQILRRLGQVRDGD
ncbi:helix-turn-helix domain-containing protein [Streptomyces sp. G3]|uniref:helix-turn-helix domain-containing protein n=1 Tax=Streptomyces sp. G3 TaxID=690144 RepID=UPI00202E25A8|nr:helix-turn-helix domain-containing protein [Streptomyces sp. G3]MCM1943200.1 helix-turn-helix domain-containing protein [Streptomyces sp. G3]